MGESPGTINCGGLPVVGVEHFGTLFVLGGLLVLGGQQLPSKSFVCTEDVSSSSIDGHDFEESWSFASTAWSSELVLWSTTSTRNSTVFMAHFSERNSFDQKYSTSGRFLRAKFPANTANEVPT